MAEVVTLEPDLADYTEGSRIAGGDQAVAPRHGIPHGGHVVLVEEIVHIGRDAPALGVIAQARIHQKPPVGFACLRVVDIAIGLALIAGIHADVGAHVEVIRALERGRVLRGEGELVAGELIAAGDEVGEFRIGVAETRKQIQIVERLCPNLDLASEESRRPGVLGPEVERASRRTEYRDLLVVPVGVENVGVHRQSLIEPLRAQGEFEVPGELRVELVLYAGDRIETRAAGPIPALHGEAEARIVREVVDEAQLRQEGIEPDLGLCRRRWRKQRGKCRIAHLHGRDVPAFVFLMIVPAAGDERQRRQHADLGLAEDRIVRSLATWPKRAGDDERRWEARECEEAGQGGYGLEVAVVLREEAPEDGPHTIGGIEELQFLFERSAVNFVGEYTERGRRVVEVQDRGRVRNRIGRFVLQAERLAEIIENAQITGTERGVLALGLVHDGNAPTREQRPFDRGPIRTAFTLDPGVFEDGRQVVGRVDAQPGSERHVVSRVVVVLAECRVRDESVRPLAVERDTQGRGVLDQRHVYRKGAGAGVFVSDRGPYLSLRIVGRVVRAYLDRARQGVAAGLGGLRTPQNLDLPQIPGGVRRVECRPSDIHHGAVDTLGDHRRAVADASLGDTSDHDALAFRAEGRAGRSFDHIEQVAVGPPFQFLTGDDGNARLRVLQGTADQLALDHDRRQHDGLRLFR